MRKILAVAATAAAAGIMSLGLVAAPAQAATTTQGTGTMPLCEKLNILLTDFHVIDTALTGGAGDGLYNKADLRAIAAGSNRPSPLLQEIARTHSPRMFYYIDTQAERLRADGLVSRDDLRVVKRAYGCN